MSGGVYGGIGTPIITDFHRYVAQLVTGQAEITKDIRDAVKTAAFETLYQNNVNVGMFLNFCREKEVPVQESVVVDHISFALESLLKKDMWWTSNEPKDFRSGIYDHFKGGVYKAMKVALFVDNDRWFVDYISMTNEKDFGRFLDDWCSLVVWPDGRIRSRFVYRGQDLSANSLTLSRSVVVENSGV